MNLPSAYTQRLRSVGWAAIGMLWSSASLAAPLGLASNALEVQIGVEPNILLVTDDSGSMNWGLMTPDLANPDSGVLYLGSFGYYQTHPGSSASGAVAPATHESAYHYIAPDPVYLASQGVASPQGGVWRAWSSDYNAIYYDTNVTYLPWRGLDSAGNPFGPVSPNAAPYDPYRPANGSLDLTTTLSYATDCYAAECTAAGISDITVTDFYPARYYSWRDSDNDGQVDPDDAHTLYEIRTSGCSTDATCISADVTRSVLDESTGVGRSDCGPATSGQVSCSYAEEIQNFANWFSYYRKRDLTAKAALSGVLETVINARVGFHTINNNAANWQRASSMNEAASSGNKLAVLNALYATRPLGGTPLRVSLDKAGKYFSCVSGDIFGATSNSSPGAALCPLLANTSGGACQQNYTILMTDGFWNGSDPGMGNTDQDGSSPYANGAFADTYSNTLADVAMHYYKRDLHSTLSDKVPTTPRDLAGYRGTGDLGETMHQHMSTYAIGFGVSGSLSAEPESPDAAFPWPDPSVANQFKIDDLRHAAYNGRGQYLSATNPVALQQSLAGIFEEIEGSTGAASAVAFNTQNIESGSLVFRAFFNTKTNTGDLVAQKVNLNGTVDPEIQWSAASRLDSKAQKSADNRVIVTYLDDGAASSAGAAFRWNDLSAAQQISLDSPQPSLISPETVGEERLNYLRGHRQDEGVSEANGKLRERPAVAGRLGDIVHSSPVFVGKPPYVGRNNLPYPQLATKTYAEFQYAQRDRRHMVYVGANDGMLHAFDANTGEEVFAYVPNSLYQKLSQQTRPSYNHTFYVDGSPQANDVYSTAAGWRSILVGGLGAGGKGYYALNVNDPTAFTTEASAKTNVLWEFTDADDADLGYAFSTPVLAMSNAKDASNENRWIAIWGNGYNSTSADGDSALFIAFIDGGEDGVWTQDVDYFKITTGYGRAESGTDTPNGIGGVRAVDANGDGTVDYLYGGDLQGNLFRFNLTSASPSIWGSPFRLFQATRKADGGTQPITTAPIVSTHPQGGYAVIVSTGSWMTDTDATSADIQSIYGLWDIPNSTSTIIQHNLSVDQLVEQNFTNQVDPIEGFAVRTLSDNDVIWKNNGSAASQVRGWYIDLDVPVAGGSTVEFPGERAVRNLQLRGGIVFVNTVLPRNSSTDPCAQAPGGFELAFDPSSGGVPDSPIFDLNGDGSFSRNDNVGGLDGLSNVVTGVRFENSTPTDSSFIGDRRITQTSDKKIRAIKTNTSDAVAAGRQSWKELAR